MAGLIDGSVLLYDLVLGRFYRLSSQHGAATHAVAISGDGRWGVTVSAANSGDPTIVFWDFMPPDNKLLSDLLNLPRSAAAAAADS